MIYATLSLSRRVVGGAALLVLVLLLVACGGGSASNKSNGVKSTSAQPARQVISTATTTNNILSKTYKGTSFTIEYPATWKLTASSTEVAFTDPSGGYNLTIGLTPNPNGAKTADQLADGGIGGAKTNLKDVQVLNVSPTTMVGGQAWSQRSISGTSTLNGQSSAIEATVLANNYPTHTTATRGYVIVYVAAKDQFAQAKTAYFQPMLESFKYTS